MPYRNSLNVCTTGALAWWGGGQQSNATNETIVSLQSEVAKQHVTLADSYSVIGILKASSQKSQAEMTDLQRES